MTYAKEIGRKYAYEYGKRWHVETPRYAIGILVNRLHVGAPDNEIAELISARIAKSPDAAKYTPAIIRECARYALIVHERNRDLYRRVMRGRL